MRRNINAFVAIGLLLLAGAGCVTGKPAIAHPTAIDYHGARVTLVLKRGRMSGELLEAHDTALVVLTEKAVMLVPFRAIRSGHFLGFESPLIGAKPSAQTRSRIRRLSRFPAGAPSSVLVEIMRSVGQTAPVVVED